MLLVIDAGNTNVTFGVFRGETLIAQWRLLTERRNAEFAEVRSTFETAGVELKNIEAIAIASVVPPLDETLKRMAEVEFGLTPLFVDHTTDSGLKVLYDKPSEIGADRIVDAAAAVAKYGAPCIVVDFGTATTFNAVNAEREYLGGV